jgi:predicted RNase H-like HicB family nuclease
MPTYDLYLESGPKRRKTMVHVPELLGCVATGPTTEDALAATPDAIRAFRRFLAAHGEAVGGEDEPVQTRIVEHVTEGDWLGNGSPYILIPTDLVPLGDAEVELLLVRFDALQAALAGWAEGSDDAALDAQPAEGGRTARRILLHVLGTPGGYLASALGTTPGFSAVAGAAERGEVDLPTALRRVSTMARDRVALATPEERAAVRERPNNVRTLRKAFRRMLEHDWEHLVELSRRPGGPSI